MTTLYVNYCARSKLPCAGQSNPDVLLCLKDSALIAPTDCPPDSELTYVGAYAEATLCQWYSSGDCGGPIIYTYTFAYDAAILADADTPLQSADISGVFCKDCLTDYFEYLIGDEAYIRTEEDDSQTFVSQHGCEYPIVGGGSGGGCVHEVTTAELNAAIAGSTLQAGCTYIVTDFVQGRIVASAKVYLIAVSTNQVEAACSVLTTYDTKLWRGVYDVSTNLLFELEDNQGNICRQFPDSAFGPFTPIEDFDWGNSNIKNCLVDNATWVLDYGVAPAYGITNVRLGGASTLSMTGWTGSYIYDLTIQNYSQVDITNSNAEFEEVTFINSGFAQIRSTRASFGTSDTFLFLTTVDSSFIVADVVDSSLYMEGCYVQGYSGVYHRVVGDASLFSVNINSFGEFRTGSNAPSPTGSVNRVSLENSNLRGVRNGIPVRGSSVAVEGTNTAVINLAQVDVDSGGAIKITDATHLVTIEFCAARSNGLLDIHNATSSNALVRYCTAETNGALVLNKTDGDSTIKSSTFSGNSVTTIGGSGSVDIEDNVITTGSTLDVTGTYTDGCFIFGNTITNYSNIDLTGTSIELYNSNTSVGTITVSNADSSSYIDGITVTNYGRLNHFGLGSIQVIACNITDESYLQIDGSAIIDPLQSASFEGVTVNSHSWIYLYGPDITNMEMSHSVVSEESTVAITPVGDFFIQGCNFSSHATLTATGSAIITYTDVKQGSLNNNGFNLSDVYCWGVGTKTATADNSGKGKDYFNDNII